MSDGGDDGDLSAIAWPGFVDILSAVIIMFVFFVLITASALYFHIIIFKSKIISEIESETETKAQEMSKEMNKEITQENQELKSQVQEMQQKLEIMEKVIEEQKTQFHHEASKFAESKDQEIKEDPETRTITIMFGKDAISLTDDTKNLLDALIPQYMKGQDPESVEVMITSPKDPGAVTESQARQSALARMLNVRNKILETEIPKSNIIPRMADPEELQESYNWVKIIFRKKQ